MILLFLIGASAVGKMSVGQELAKITEFRLFYNHMTIEPVIELFGGFNLDVTNKLRQVVFEEIAKSSACGAENYHSLNEFVSLMQIHLLININKLIYYF